MARLVHFVKHFPRVFRGAYIYRLHTGCSGTRHLGFLANDHGIFRHVIFGIFRGFVDGVLTFSCNCRSCPERRNLMPQSRSANAFAYLFRLAVLADGFVDFDDRRFTPYANILQIGGRQRKQTGFAGQHRCLAGRQLQTFHRLVRFGLRARLHHDFRDVRRVGGRRIGAILFRIRQRDGGLVA